MAKPPPDESLALSKRIVDLGREMRAEEPVVLDLRALVDYTDFFVLLTGRSARQNQAIADHLVRTLKAGGKRAISKSGLDTGSWICIDLADVVVHVFDPPTRDRYDLELLWADALRVDVPEPAKAAPKPAPVAPPEPATEQPEEAAPSKRRRRVVRVAAVEDADAANAPDAERPPVDEPEPPAPKTPKTSKTPKKKAVAKKTRSPRRRAP